MILLISQSYTQHPQKTPPSAAHQPDPCEPWRQPQGLCVWSLRFPMMISSLTSLDPDNTSRERTDIDSTVEIWVWSLNLWGYFSCGAEQPSTEEEACPRCIWSSLSHFSGWIHPPSLAHIHHQDAVLVCSVIYSLSSVQIPISLFPAEQPCAVNKKQFPWSPPMKLCMSKSGAFTAFLKNSPN